MAIRTSIVIGTFTVFTKFVYHNLVQMLSTITIELKSFCSISLFHISLQNCYTMVTEQNLYWAHAGR